MEESPGIPAAYRSHGPLAAQPARLHGGARVSDEELRTLVESEVRASLTVASSDAQHPGGG